MHPRRKQRLQLNRKRLELDGVLRQQWSFAFGLIFPGCFQLHFLSALICFAWACSYILLLDGLLNGLRL